VSRILGIDPGLSGAFALLEGPSLTRVWDAPVVCRELDCDETARIVREARPDIAVIERVASRPDSGVASAFKFGSVYGGLRGVVAACGIPQYLVVPTVWKRHFRLSADKEQARALAIKLWPGLGYFSRVKDHDRAEAALLARYGAEMVKGIQ
jgi:hypothetical protein